MFTRENVSCENKEQLHREERKHIEANKCVNKCVPTRTKKEYYEDNKEQLAEKNKQYYEDNKEQRLEKQKQYYEDNKEQLLEKMKEYREANKEQRIEKQKQYRLKKKALKSQIS